MPGELLAGGLSAPFRLPPHALAALVPLLVLIVGLDAWCLVDLARAKSVRNAPKLVWVLVILFVSAPAGAIIYLFLGRDHGRGRQDAPAAAAAAAGTASPAATASPAGAGRPQGDPQPVVTTRGRDRGYHPGPAARAPGGRQLSVPSATGCPARW